MLDGQVHLWGTRMFSIVDNDACTLYLQFVDDQVAVYGDVRYFNKTTYKDTKAKWEDTLEALRQEGYPCIFSQLKKTQTNMIEFERKQGFEIVLQTSTDYVLVKEL